MTVGWKFSRSSVDEGRSGGNPSEYTFDHDLPDFVRETLQNSNDAGYDRPGPTEVTYEIREITGDDVEEFMRHLQWNSTDATEDALKHHMEAVAEESTDASVRQVYEEIEIEGRLVVVTIHDHNTHGLYGPEGGRGPFSALVLDELITEKEGGTGRTGSYGLGKAVLWSWSGLKTVLFNSTPQTTPDGETPPRLIARTQLPSHEADAEEYRFEGQGLFGSLNGSGRSTAVSVDDDTIYKWGGGGRPYSVWGDEAAAIATKLGLDRPAESYGTSVSVLGFCEPGGGSQPSADEIADEIATEASKWFWPAMLRGDLEVTIETNDGEFQVEPDRCDDVKPFVRCVQNRHNTRDVLDQPGDVGVQTPDFEIENKTEAALDEDEDEDNLETESGPIGVYARLANPERSGSLTNTVALVRGGGMVVKYYDRNRIVYGGRKFHGVVLAGTARLWSDEDPTPADKDIDEYLRAAEPPRHDDWEYTKKLKSQYERGARSTIEGLQRQIITDAIKNLIRETRDEGRLVAGRLADRLNIPQGVGEREDEAKGKGGGGPQVFNGTSEISFDGTADRWTFSGFARILEEDYEAWEATVTLHRLDEEGNVVGTIPIDRLDTENQALQTESRGDRYLVRGGPETERFTFDGESTSAPPRGETKINVKGRVFVGGLDA